MPSTPAWYGFCGAVQCCRPSAFVAQVMLKLFSVEDMVTQVYGGAYSLLVERDEG